MVRVGKMQREMQGGAGPSNGLDIPLHTVDRPRRDGRASRTTPTTLLRVAASPRRASLTLQRLHILAAL